ncbi:MAG: hypothetical protein WDO12_08780 [Pseudomonadota bacterium]
MGDAKLEENKRLVLAFHEQIIGRKDFEAARRYMGATYKQQRPTPPMAPKACVPSCNGSRRTSPTIATR